MKFERKWRHLEWDTREEAHVLGPKLLRALSVLCTKHLRSEHGSNGQKC